MSGKQFNKDDWVEGEPIVGGGESDIDDSEMIDAGGGSSDADIEFDRVIGVIGEIVMNPQFAVAQATFLDQYCDEFEDAEDNKLCYTEIFNNYVSLIESALDQGLARFIPGFSMDAFQALLPDRLDEIPEELMEMLMSLSDFCAFKELMLEHKAAKNGGAFAGGDFFKVTSLEHKHGVAQGRDVDMQLGGISVQQQRLDEGGGFEGGGEGGF